MQENFYENIERYKEQVYEGSPICVVYHSLISFVHKLRSTFSKETTQFKVGGISQGYMDYTYFPFFDETLRNNKLRFGIVLNHTSLQFELWLMAQNASEQIDQWEKLKHLSWNKEKTSMPKYTVLDVVIEPDPDFKDLELLADTIVKKALAEVEKIAPFIGS